jgi:hypothetical protein
VTTATVRPNPLVFLSSVLNGGDAVPSGLRPERERVYRHGEAFGHNSVWVDEIIEPNRGPDPLAAIDDFLFELQRSRVYLAMIASDWPGSGITIAERSANATFFETELFYAAVLGRPIVVIVRTDIRISPETRNLLSLLQRVLPRIAWHQVASASEVEDRAKRVVDQVATGKLQELAPKRDELGRLLRYWWNWREPDVGAPGLRWLDGRFLPIERAPSAAIVEECLRLTPTAPSERQRLSRLWIAARELMGVPHDRSTDPHWLDLWNRVLTEWNSASAWYGLHGHSELGYLAALNTLFDIRKSGRILSHSLNDDPAWDPPYASLASAYYATARRVSSRRLRQIGLRRALSLLDSAVARDDLTRSNVLAVRGSVLQKLWAFNSSVDVYREVLRLRKSSPSATQGSIGEAMTELGFGLLFTFRWREGRDLLREGVSLMETGNYRRGFVVRGKRKLATGLLLTGDLGGARSARDEANRLDIESTVGHSEGPVRIDV